MLSLKSFILLLVVVVVATTTTSALEDLAKLPTERLYLEMEDHTLEEGEMVAVREQDMDLLPEDVQGRELLTCHEAGMLCQMGMQWYCNYCCGCGGRALEVEDPNAIPLSDLTEDDLAKLPASNIRGERKLWGCCDLCRYGLTYYCSCCSNS